MKYFTLDELTSSTTARLRRLDNTPGPREVANLNYLVDTLLDPLREAFGRPIVVTSGYRSEELNRLVGGVTMSYHMRGLAADITALGHDRKENRRLRQLLGQTELPFDECISYDVNADGPLWLHLQLRDTDHTNRYRYLQG